ncbi:hypothetical protein [Paenibacillus glucanolyticus]|uniref:hypothetical protein n=1 Tax=Paenibacillus glucanolyticus TaxID=59843 RepID=UPI0030CABDCA
MKKVFVGILIGLLLTVSTTALASGVNNLIGKKVDGVKNVTLNGETIGQAVIIQGKSYLPVREVANGYGSAIELEKSGEISLSSPVDNNSSSATSDVDAINKKIQDKKYEIDRTKSEIAGLEKQAAELKERVDRNAEQGVIGVADNNYAVINNALNKAKDKLSVQEQELADLEAQLAALQE